MSKPKITFDESARSFILAAFGKTIDRQDYIVEEGNRSRRVLTKDGMEIKKNNFAGITKGSEIYYKSDVTSLIDMYDDLARKQTERE